MRSLLIVLALLAAGCPTAPDPEEFTCALGFSSEDGFVPLGDAPRGELVLGFQGFLFVTTRLHTAAEITGEFEVLTSVEPTGGEVFGGVQARVTWSADASGWASDEVLVFFDDGNVAAFVGREATIALRARNDTDFCVATADVLLVDDDPCIHTDAEPICPEEDDDDSGDDDDSAR